MRIQMRRLRRAVAASCLPFAFTAVAQAQSTGSAVTLEEVIVTGEKINRSLQETVTSVAVTTAERIEEENLLTLQDVYNRTANVSETYGSAGFTIRGIANNGVSGAGNAPLSTVYLNFRTHPNGRSASVPTSAGARS